MMIVAQSCISFASRPEMDSDTVVKSEPVEQSNAVRSHKGHSRSKSQTLISFAGPTNDELMKHFERSLEPKIVVPNHAKSKSLPRPMRGKFCYILLLDKTKSLTRLQIKLDSGASVHTS